MFITIARFQSVDEKLGLFSELSRFISCENLRKQDGELSISAGASSESIRCEVVPRFFFFCLPTQVVSLLSEIALLKRIGKVDLAGNASSTDSHSACVLAGGRVDCHVADGLVDGLTREHMFGNYFRTPCCKE